RRGLRLLDPLGDEARPDLRRGLSGELHQPFLALAQGAVGVGAQLPQHGVARRELLLAPAEGLGAARQLGVAALQLPLPPLRLERAVRQLALDGADAEIAGVAALLRRGAGIQLELP